MRIVVNHIGMDAMEEIGEIELGSKGTRKWSRGEIHWAANTGLIIVSTGIIIAGMEYFNFMLVPLMLAYFITFLVAPIMDLLEHRPLKSGACDPGYELDPDNEQRRAIDPSRRQAELTGQVSTGNPHHNLPSRDVHTCMCLL